MNEQRKVYVVSKGYHDFSPAAQYGKLVFLSTSIFGRTAVSNMVRTFEPQLENSSSDDFILITGLSVMCSIACSIFALKHGRLNLLLFDAATDKYVKRTVILEEDKESEIA